MYKNKNNFFTKLKEKKKNVTFRIKYVEYKSGIFYSKNKLISSKNKEYTVRLDKNNMTFTIFNAKTNRSIYHSAKFTNNNAYLRAVRREIKRLDINIKQEIKNRSFGLCEKNYTQKKHIETIKKQYLKELEPYER